MIRRAFRSARARNQRRALRSDLISNTFFKHARLVDDDPGVLRATLVRPIVNPGPGTLCVSDPAFWDEFMTEFDGVKIRSIEEFAASVAYATRTVVWEDDVNAVFSGEQLFLGGANTNLVFISDTGFNRTRDGGMILPLPFQAPSIDSD